MFIYETNRPDEDLIQTAWLEALESTPDRPQAYTVEELQQKYQHIAGLVVRIYQRRKIDARRRSVAEPLTEDVPVEYTMISDLIDCTPRQREAIDFYLSLVQQSYPITPAQRARLKRYRKQTGLALDLNY